MTDITAPFVIPPDVELRPAAELAERVRRGLRVRKGDHTVGRRGSRARLKVLDAAGAELLGHFREPTRIVEAVLRYSVRHDKVAREVLESAYPLLAALVADHVLVPAASPEAAGLKPSLPPGARVAGWRVLSPVQVLSDTEVYAAGRGGTRAALKILRPDGPAASGQALVREAAILRRLDGVIGPRLLGSGEHAGRPFVLTEWRWGVRADLAARERRADLARGAPGRLLALCQAIARSFARLHALGVLHGDVQPGNVLVSSGNGITLLDFGAARFTAEEADSVPRVGTHAFIEPEQAQALLEGRGAPPLSERSEQYAVAALLSRLAAGEPDLDFSPRESECLRQSAEDPPLSFAARGAPAWPQLERTLARALEKSPARRYASLGALCVALAAVRAPSRRPTPVLVARRDRFLGALLARLDADAPLFAAGALPAPEASVHSGAAGIAFALLRIARARDDAALFALADLWLQRALSALAAPGRLGYPEAKLTDRVGRGPSLLHGAAGVRFVEAQVADGAGDAAGRGAAVAAFVTASMAGGGALDVVFGRAGTLLGCALLAEGAGEYGAGRDLRLLGDRTLRDLMDRAAALGAVGRRAGRLNLGAAHGWAGALYAALRWCSVAGTPLPPVVAARLEELAAWARPDGRGLRWPWLGAAPGRGMVFMPGWCNGGAGMVFTWALAAEVLAEARYRDLAERAAASTWAGGDGVATLCCGAAGRAYAMLRVFRLTGASRWRVRAERLADQAVRAAEGATPGGEWAAPYSLYRGDAGIGVLAAELQHPGDARMPLYEGDPVSGTMSRRGGG